MSENSIRRVAASFAAKPATCKVCGFEWTPLADEQTRFCYGCWDLAKTFLDEGDVDYIDQHIEDSADRTNRTSRTVRKHFNDLLDDVAEDEAQRIAAERRRRGERSSWCGTR